MCDHKKVEEAPLRETIEYVFMKGCCNKKRVSERIYFLFVVFQVSSLTVVTHVDRYGIKTQKMKKE